MTRRFRKPGCYGNAWGEDCISCKYTKDCKIIIEKEMGEIEDGKKSKKEED